MRKALAAVLVLAIGLWAEAGLALLQAEPVMQCSMAVHGQATDGDMSCCPGEMMQSPAAAADQAPCCRMSSEAERPISFVVSPKQIKISQLEVVAAVPATSAAPAAQGFEAGRNADAPRFVKPVFELKTDLRI